MSGKHWVEHLKSQLAPDAQARLATERQAKTPKNKDLFVMAVADGANAAEALAKTRITGSSIDEMLKDLPPDRALKVGPNLRKYEGWTWKAALDAHSVEKPKVN